MAIVYVNAKATQERLLREQRVSACWPYDAARHGTLSGLAYCKLETAELHHGSLSMLRGPDFFCSYLLTEYCDVQQSE